MHAEKDNEVFPLTDSELLQMAGSQFPSQTWQKAFNVYNQDKRNNRVSMGCRSCFSKVLVYFLERRLKISHA